ARRPRWCLEVLRAGGPGFRSLETYAAQMDISGDGGTIVSEFIRRHMGGVLDWDYLARVREIWAGPLILKGVLSGEDAARAVELGVDALLVSNHGGRQLDAAPASIEMLPEIADIVQDRARLLFDSGVRTGEDILKAIALGADFVFVGRGFQYGVAALGPRGGDHVAAILIDEMKNVMAQIGAATLGELSPEWIHDAYAGA
ncbi:MAG: alpha-hydroxy acid oxidase, partial [Alphaproteobacteria bacterium]|nr:alpha-hydroxy acid oxidase [Alphaproteobacteria bacterium]